MNENLLLKKLFESCFLLFLFRFEKVEREKGTVAQKPFEWKIFTHVPQPPQTDPTRPGLSQPARHCPGACPPCPGRTGDPGKNSISHCSPHRPPIDTGKNDWRSPSSGEFIEATQKLKNVRSRLLQGRLSSKFVSRFRTMKFHPSRDKKFYRLKIQWSMLSNQEKQS